MVFVNPIYMYMMNDKFDRILLKMWLQNTMHNDIHNNVTCLFYPIFIIQVSKKVYRSFRYRSSLA